MSSEEPSEEPTLEDRMDSLFDALDQVPDDPTKRFGPFAARERFESYIMYAYRRRQGARYHFDRVLELLRSRPPQSHPTSAEGPTVSNRRPLGTLPVAGSQAPTEVLRVRI